MTMLSVIRCDACGRTQELRPGYPVADQTSGWGVLHVGGHDRDLCPVCTGLKSLNDSMDRHPASGTLRGSHLRAS